MTPSSPGGVSPMARRIASGHAFRKHVVRQGEYPSITSSEQFARLIDDVLTNPDATKTLLDGRRAFWKRKARTVVILDPGHPDGGTAFRPTAGKAFFDRLQ